MNSEQFHDCTKISPIILYVIDLLAGNLITFMI